MRNITFLLAAALVAPFSAGCGGESRPVIDTMPPSTAMPGAAPAADAASKQAAQDTVLRDSTRRDSTPRAPGKPPA